MSGYDEPGLWSSMNLDPRLRLKCCGANRKERCTWAPCPANVDAWSGPELVALAAEDEHRVDDCIAFFVTPPS